MNKEVHGEKCEEECFCRPEGGDRAAERSKSIQRRPPPQTPPSRSARYRRRQSKVVRDAGRCGRALSLVVVELPQHLFHVVELLLRLLDGRLQLRQALLLCDVVGARVVLFLAVVLDLLA